MAVTRKVVLRFGANDQGADPNWIIDNQLIKKTDPVPEGWELITNTEYKQQWNAQYDAYMAWKAAQPKPARDFDKIQNRLAISVINNPSEAYRIYKYVKSDEAWKVRDVTQPPWALNYKKDIKPKLEDVLTIVKGFAINVTWNIWDYNAVDIYNAVVEEVLKVDTIYTLSDHPTQAILMPSARDILMKERTRQWIREDNTYDETLSDIMVTRHVYKKAQERNVEGQRRRTNIFVDITDKYLSLVGIITEDPAVAQMAGAMFLSQISNDVSDYKSIGSPAVLGNINNLASTTQNNGDEYYLNHVIPDNALTQQIAPDGIGMTIETYLIQKFQGII